MQSASNRPLAIVTGASAGIGQSIARELAQRGYRVLAIARRADRLAALEASSNGNIIPLTLDLTADDAIEKVAARADELGGAELLVNNAGFGNYGRFWETSFEKTLEMVQLNIKTSVGLTHRLLPEMIARKKGGVIIITSSGGMYPTPHLATYGGTKAFLLYWGEALAAELEGTGVRALVVCPGATKTEFGDVAGMAEMLAKAPGLSEPAEIAKATVDAWEAKRVLSVPGVGNWVMSAVFQRLPRDLTRKLTAAMFKAPTA